MLTTPSDLAAILAGCRKRKRGSQHDLYRLFYGYAMSVAVRYVAEENEAITVTNDAFLKVYKNIKSFDADRAFKPWFRRIVINTALNHISKQEKYRKETGMDQADHIAAREEILSRISYQELVALVQSLTTAYRTVFNMYVIDGFRHEEIAKHLGITVSTSKSNLVRARRKLQELLTEQLYPSQSGWANHHLSSRPLLSPKSLADAKASPTFFGKSKNHAAGALEFPNHSVSDIDVKHA